MEENNKVAELVRKNEQNYILGNVTISEYVNFNMHDTIEKIDAYLNSKHTTGETDSLNREKPFFNICTSNVNIWYRATDVDRSDIKIKPTRITDTFAAYVATLHLQDWMRKERWGTFLNDWSRTLARYGSAVVKFVEQGGELKSNVVPWNRLIVDPIDFDNNVVIEVLELTPAQLLKNKNYDQKIVSALLKTTSARETIGKQKKDTRDDFIKLYEVHGELPLSYLTGKEKDEDTYVQQMHVISYVASKENGKFDDYTLISGKEEKNPYMITHLIKEDGRTLAIGSVENLFESQWMVNHTAKQIKDQLDLASKLIFQTSDGNFVGQNVLTAIESGDIMIHKTNEPLTQLGNSSHDITSLQSYGEQWQALGKEINGISEAMQGNTKSGTAWHQTEMLLQESHSLFEMMVENKANHLDDMLRIYVIPFLKKKLNSTKELVATLEDYGVDKIEKKYIRNRAIKNYNAKIKESILQKGEVPNDVSLEGEMSNLKNAFAESEMRFIKPSDIEETTWKESLKDLEWDLEIDISGEQKDTQSVMTTLTTVFRDIGARQGRPLTAEEKFIFNKILEETGAVSTIELAAIPQETQPSVTTNSGKVGTDMSNLKEVASNNENNLWGN